MMDLEFPTARVALAALLALFCAACQGTPVPLPDRGPVELRPVSPEDPRFSGIDVVGQATRPDGAWVFNYLAPAAPGTETQGGGISVLTDVAGASHYELPELEGESIDDAGWASERSLLLYSRAWNRIVTLEFDEGSEGVPSLTVQGRKPRPANRYDDSTGRPLMPGTLAPAASYQRVDRPWPMSNQ